MRAGLPGSRAVVEDWPALLAGAGLEPAGTRTFLTDVPAPLPRPAREYLRDHLTRLLTASGDQLAADDREVLEQLVDETAETGVLRRPDAFYLNATTVHTGRAVTS